MNLAQQHEPAGYAVLSDDSPSRSVTLQSVTGYKLRLDVFEEEPPTWFWRLVADANALLRLPQGWNSHNAAPVPPDAAATALDIVVRALLTGAPYPHITPLSSGGLQIEWHEPQFEIEATVDREGVVTVWSNDSRSGNDVEFTDEQGAPRLLDLIGKLTRPA
jgi:hypothetical protein